MLDYLISNGKIVDGSGRGLKSKSVGIRGDRIKIVESGGTVKKTIVLGSGDHILPGFCDIHSHNDLYVLASDGERLLRQGLTTVVNGNCGLGIFPVKDKKLLKNTLYGIKYAFINGRMVIDNYKFKKIKEGKFIKI